MIPLSSPFSVLSGGRERASLGCQKGGKLGLGRRLRLRLRHTQERGGKGGLEVQEEEEGEGGLGVASQADGRRGKGESTPKQERRRKHAMFTVLLAEGAEGATPVRGEADKGAAARPSAVSPSPFCRSWVWLQWVSPVAIEEEGPHTGRKEMEERNGENRQKQMQRKRGIPAAAFLSPFPDGQMSSFVGKEKEERAGRNSATAVASVRYSRATHNFSSLFPSSPRAKGEDDVV